MKKFFTFLTLFTAIFLNAQDGTLDTSYGLINSFPGYSLKTITSYSEINNGWGNTVAISTNGKIIIGATSEKRASYSSPLVYSFGYHYFDINNSTISDDNLSGSGYLETCNNSIILSNLKSLIVGQKDFGENTISYQGGIHISRKAILMQRNNSDGTPDTSLNAFGQITLDIGYEEEFQSIKEWNNKLYACGYTQTLENQPKKLLLAKLNLDGNLDTSFNSTGYKTIDLPGFENSFDLTVQSDGKILVLSKSSNLINKFLVYRFNTDASLDTSFGSNGLSEIIVGNIGTGFPKKIQLQNDEKILIAGTFYENNTINKFAAIKLNQNGSIDTSFANNGRYISLIGTGNGGKLASMKLLENNKILLVGNLSSSSGIGIVRLNSNGTLDNLFGTNGISTIINSNVTSVIVGDFVIKPNYKIIIVGAAKANAPNNKLQIFTTQVNNSIAILSTTDDELKDKFSIYPNPTNNFITIQNKENSTESYDYKIVDLTGRIVKSGNSKFNEQINVESLTSGNYIIQIQTDSNQFITQKLIKN